jgi:hypothetical protein
MFVAAAGCFGSSGKKGGRIRADHIKPFCLFPELRFVVSNGRTICDECDLKSDTYGGRAIKVDKSGNVTKNL